MTFKLMTKQFTLAGILGLSLLASACATQDGSEVADAGSERECRTQTTKGSKMRQSICLTKKEWRRIDAQQAAILAESDATEEYLRRVQEFNSQYPVGAADRYNPYPGSQQPFK